MRIASLKLFLGASALATAQAQHSLFHDGVPARSTYFDGNEVPPLLKLTTSNIESEFNRTKFLVVTYGSPYCPHCIRFTPTFQTLYEYYYTSNPPENLSSPSDPTATTFEEYYDIRFSTVNCLALPDLCVENGINAYPQTVLYRNGEVISSLKGSKKIADVSNLIENALEAEYPGTRPQDILLPTPGSNSRPVPEDKVKGEVSTDESQKPIFIDEAAGQGHSSV